MTSRGPAPRSAMRTALIWFSVASMTTLSVLVGVVVVSGEAAARDATVDSAEQHTRQVAGRTVARSDMVAVAGRDAAATATFAERMRRWVHDGWVSHVVVWGGDGTVVWSDAGDLVGRVLPLPGDVARLVGTRGVHTEPQAHAGELPGLRAAAGLVEVCLGVRDATGVPFVLVAYVAPGPAASTGMVARTLLPVALACLLCFTALMLPMACSLARRVDRARRQRAEAFESSLRAWHAERSRLAQELHDTVVQDLSAAAYALGAMARQMPTFAGTDGHEVDLTEVTATLRGGLNQLREVAWGLTPPGEQSLDQALEELARRNARRGLDVRVEMEGRPPTGATADLVYRVAREALNNTVKHSGSPAARVRVSGDESCTRVVVSDDGCGLKPPLTTDRSEGRHLGLRLLADTVRQAGGRLVLGASASGGAELTAVVPAASTSPSAFLSTAPTTAPSVAPWRHRSRRRDERDEQAFALAQRQGAAAEAVVRSRARS